MLVLVEKYKFLILILSLTRSGRRNQDLQKVPLDQTQGLESISMSVFPVVRMPTEMHDGKNIDPRRLDAIQHAKGESVDKTASDVILDERPCIGMVDDSMYGVEYLD